MDHALVRDDPEDLATRGQVAALGERHQALGVRAQALGLGHGGGDALLLRRLFSGEEIPDPLGHMAGSRAGAMSILTGIAANQSIASGQRVKVDELLK